MEAGDEDSVSIRAIAERVGVTAPSIYMHFSDKQELMRSVCDRHFERFASQLEAAVSGVDDPLEALRRRGHAYVDYGVSNPEHYRILFMTRGRDAPMREDFEAGRAGGPAFMGLIANVQACMDSGVFAPGDPFPVATALFALVHGITSLRISSPGFPSLDDDSFLDQALLKPILGLASPKPLEP